MHHHHTEKYPVYKKVEVPVVKEVKVPFPVHVPGNFLILFFNNSVFYLLCYSINVVKVPYPVVIKPHIVTVPVHHNPVHTEEHQHHESHHHESHHEKDEDKDW